MFCITIIYQSIVCSFLLSLCCPSAISSTPEAWVFPAPSFLMRCGATFGIACLISPSEKWLPAPIQYVQTRFIIFPVNKFSPSDFVMHFVIHLIPQWGIFQPYKSPFAHKSTFPVPHMCFLFVFSFPFPLPPTEFRSLLNFHVQCLITFPTSSFSLL